MHMDDTVNTCYGTRYSLESQNRRILPRDKHSAVWLRQVVRPSARPSVRDVEVSWTHRLEFLQNNFMTD